MPLRGFHRSWRWVLIAWFQKYVAKIFSARNNNHRRPATCPRTLNAFASVGHIDLEYFRTESENVPLMQGLVTPFRRRSSGLTLPEKGPESKRRFTNRYQRRTGAK